jgi:asparagine synthase (glutamine-hydrolysing)
MGAILLVRRDAFGPNDPKAVKVHSALTKQGFSELRRFETTHWMIYLAPKFGGGRTAVHISDAENFAAYTGTLLYRGTTGQQALKSLFDEFAQRNTIAWPEIYGSFCIVIYRNGRLHLLPDRLGVYKIYRNVAGTVISSSFLAALESIEDPTPDLQSIYEYVFQGATYDGRTVIGEVNVMERNAAFELNPEIKARSRHEDLWDAPPWSNYEDYVARVHEALRQEFRSIVQCFGDNIDTALSGGYDSRLLLALLREQGVSPRVHVYGSADDEDVALAKAIAARDRFEIAHIDKARDPEPSVERLPSVIARNFFLFDGYPADGIFDNGSDARTRQDRCANAGLAMNGGGGEIFRNFFYLADRSFAIRKVLWAFFSQFDPRICTRVFDEEAYLANLGVAVASLLGLPDQDGVLEQRLSRGQIEFLYPCLRCVYWMGRNNSVNNRLGYFCTPFIETEPIRLALQIPIEFKNHGLFEAGLIRAADPRLAQYPSVYGRGFTEGPSVWQRTKSRLTIARPPYLRRYSYRFQRRLQKVERTGIFRDKSLAAVIDPSFPQMRGYFNVGAVSDSEQFNRICTLEYLFEQYGVLPGEAMLRSSAARDRVARRISNSIR